MAYSTDVLQVAARNPDGLLTPEQVLTLLGQHDVRLEDVLAELPLEDGEVWRSAEYLLAFLGY
jgi:hypothetical protein